MTTNDTEPRVKLYELSATVRYDVVVAAVSESDARDAISTWQQAWASNSDFRDVCDIDLTDVRELQEPTKKFANDHAHEISTDACGLLSDEDEGESG